MQPTGKILGTAWNKLTLKAHYKFLAFCFRTKYYELSKIRGKQSNLACVFYFQYLTHCLSFSNITLTVLTLSILSIKFGTENQLLTKKLTTLPNLICIWVIWSNLIFSWVIEVKFSQIQSHVNILYNDEIFCCTNHNSSLA